MFIVGSLLLFQVFSVRQGWQRSRYFGVRPGGFPHFTEEGSAVVLRGYFAAFAACRTSWGNEENRLQ
jgi:hypothetical protein